MRLTTTTALLTLLSGVLAPCADAQPRLTFWLADGDGADEDRIVVYDSVNGRSSLPLVDAFGVTYGWPGDLLRAGGTVYGTDILCETLIMFDENTQLVTPIGTAAGGPGWDTRLTCLAHDPAQGLLYAGDSLGTSTNRIFVHDLQQGTWVRTITDLPVSEMTGLCWDAASGLLYMYDADTGQIHSLDPVTEATQFVTTPVHAPGDMYDELDIFNGQIYGSLHIPQSGPDDSIQVRRIDLATGEVRNIGPVIADTDGHALMIESMVPDARCTFRNGSGINPTGFTCVTPPVVGANWTVDITLDPSTAATLLLIGSGPHPGIPLFDGEFLTLILPVAMWLPGMGTHVVPIPPAPSLYGGQLTTQGFRVDDVGGQPKFVLMNAQDIQFGL